MNTVATSTETHYALIENRKIAYRRYGEGSPIILINRFRGTLGTSDTRSFQSAIFVRFWIDENQI